MRKTLLATLPVAAFVAGVAVVPSVFALDESYDNWDGLKTCLITPDSTCTLKADLEADLTSSGVILADNVTLNLGTHTLTINGTTKAIWVDQGHKATITGPGKIQSEEGYGVAVEGNIAGDPTELTIGEGVEINAAKPLGVYYNTAGTDQNVSKIQIDGTLTSTSSAALDINGKIRQDGPEITITGTLNGVTAGIYQAGSSTITINNGKVSGKSGIVTKAGTLILNNAQVIATGAYSEGNLAYEQGGNYALNGAALQIVSQTAEGDGNTTTYAGDIDIQINNSTLTSQNGNAIQAFGQGGEKSGIASITMSGDTHLTSAAGLPAFSNGVEGFAGVTEDGKVIDLNSNSVWPIPVPETPADTTPNPDTADPISLYITIAAVALIGLSATAVLAKKARR